MSEAPPYYRPNAPKKSNSNTILIVVLICVVVIPCVGLLLLGFLGYRFASGTVFPMVGCMITVESAQKAINTYTLEKGTFPKAETWQTDIGPYYEKQLETKRDELGPLAPQKATDVWSCKYGEPITGIAFNSNLSGKKPADIKDRSSTVVIFEVEKPVMNAHEPYRKREKSTSPKFMGNPRGWIFVKLDGHVEGIEGGGNMNFD